MALACMTKDPRYNVAADRIFRLTTKGELIASSGTCPTSNTTSPVTPLSTGGPFLAAREGARYRLAYFRLGVDPQASRDRGRSTISSGMVPPKNSARLVDRSAPWICTRIIMLRVEPDNRLPVVPHAIAITIAQRF